jgi:hypothetical protein
MANAIPTHPQQPVVMIVQIAGVHPATNQM